MGAKPCFKPGAWEQIKTSRTRAAMDEFPENDVRDRAEAFENLADQPQGGVVGEFLYFLAHNKKWWLTPIILVLLLVGLLIVLGGSGAAPFIYTLF